MNQHRIHLKSLEKLLTEGWKEVIGNAGGLVGNGFRLETQRMDILGKEFIGTVEGPFIEISLSDGNLLILPKKMALFISSLTDLDIVQIELRKEINNEQQK